MSTITPIPQPAVGTHPVLADLLAGTRARNSALVLAGTAFVAAASQLTVPLWWTPVPLSLSTFAVLLTGAALGPARAAASTVLYLALGVAGAPIFAQQTSGWRFASFGYIVGYVLGAVLIGALARRRADRSVVATALSACAATLAVYAAGVPWLMNHLHVDLATGMELGVYPFLAGDAIKAVAAALLLPAAWRAVDRIR